MSLDPDSPAPAPSVQQPPNGGNLAEATIIVAPTASVSTDFIRLSRLPGLRNENLDYVLASLPEWGASDLHISPDGLFARIAGRMKPLDGATFDDLSIKEALAGWLREEQRVEWDHNQEIDFSVSVGAERFRGHADSEISGISIVLRHIPSKPLGIPDLIMPEGVRHTLTELCDRRSGLVLVTGSTGSGKSTTLAAMIRNILVNKEVNIITLEKPIEFNLKNVPDRKGRISQREVGLHVPSFKAGIEGAMRADPDVIMVGEIRKPEELQAALAAAETGHLVLATLHTKGAVGALTRIVDMCDGADKALVRAQLAESLRGVVYQALVPLEGPGNENKRMAACEVLLDAPGVRNMIRKDTISQLDSAMQIGGGMGMLRFDDGLHALVTEGRISVETALEFANNRDELHKLIGPGHLRRVS